MVVLAQYFSWAVQHALYLSPRHWAAYKDVLTVCPGLLLAAAWAKGFSRAWPVVLGLVAIEIVLVPVGHYLLAILPFLCVMAVTAKQPIRGWAFILLAFSSVRLAKNTILPWRNVVGMRAYGMADTYEMARNVGDVQAPVWCSWPPLYFVKGWKVPVRDFINMQQIDDLHPPMDWTGINTAIEMLPAAFPLKLEGWHFKDVPLLRGQYKVMRIWRR